MARLNGKSCLKHLGAELDQAGLVGGRRCGGGQGAAGALLSKRTETRPKSLPGVGGAQSGQLRPRGGGSESKRPISADALTLRLQGRLAVSETDPSMVEGLRCPQTQSQKLKSLLPWWRGVLVMGRWWKRVLDDISLNRGWSGDGGSRGHLDLFFEVLEKLKYKELLN